MNEMQREMKRAGEDLAAVREDLVRRGKAFLLVGNKVDVIGGGDGSGNGVVEAGVLDGAGVAAAVSSVAPQVRFAEEVLISARAGKGIDVLKQRLVDLVLQGEAAGDGTIVTNARHFEALQKVSASLEVIHKGLDELLPGDLLSLDIRHCLHYLGEITGEITTEDRLGYIFGKFCIGK
jgi:tRNA U34 5-carboxymethylaminomethyl modifying GTPase MnmE/TrmE